MISAALEFIHARKWLIELVLLAVLAAAIYAGCQHLINVGVLKERAAWQAKVDQANIETARAQGRAQAADKAAQGERDALAKYVTDHPLHGSFNSLCKPPRLPTAASSQPSDAGTAAPTGGVQPLPTGSAVGESSIDSIGLLSSLAEQSDRISTQLREWQSR